MPALKINLPTVEFELSFEHLARDFESVELSEFDSKRSGEAVRLKDIMSNFELENLSFITFHASKDDFHASVPIHKVQDDGLLVFARNGLELSEQDAGPFRFFIPEAAACQMEDIDECVNVKFLDKIEFSKERGQDTRPKSEKEHEELHEKN